MCTCAYLAQVFTTELFAPSIANPGDDRPLTHTVRWERGVRDIGGFGCDGRLRERACWIRWLWFAWLRIAICIVGGGFSVVWGIVDRGVGLVERFWVLAREVPRYAGTTPRCCGLFGSAGWQWLVRVERGCLIGDGIWFVVVGWVG